MAGMELATAYVSIVPDTSGLGRQLISQGAPHMTSAGSSMGGMLGGKIVAALAAAGIATAIIGQVKQGIDGAIAQAESLNKVDVVFGAAAESVKTFAAQGAKSLGMSNATALEYVGTLGNLLTATGLTDQMSADYSTTMLGLSTDMASFNNASPEEVLEALRSGLAGETEPLKRFGVNLNEAILKQKALELGFGDIKGTMDPATRAQAAYAVIMEQTTKAQGDFARTSDGVANKQKIAAAQWEDIRNKIGVGFLPIISRVQDVVIKVLDALAGGGAGLANMFPPEVQAQLATFGASVNGLADTVMPTIRGWYTDIIKPALDGIGEAFGKLGPEILPTLTVIVDAVKAAWPLMSATLGPFIEMLSVQLTGAFEITAGVVRTVMAIIRGDWDTGWEGVKQTLGGVVDVVRGSALGAALEALLAPVKRIIYERFVIPINDLITAWNRMPGTKDLGLVHMNLGGGTGTISRKGQIPEAAGGGIISGPRSGYLVMAHGTELVTPIDKAGRGVVIVADPRFTDERKLSAFVRRANSEDIGMGGITGALAMGG